MITRMPFRARISLLIIAIIFSVVQAVGDGSKNATTLRAEAIKLQEDGDIDGAIREYRNYLALSPNDYRVMNTVAGLFGGQGKFRDELHWSDKARKANPKYMEAFINFGNAQLALGEYRQARASYETAAALAPGDPLPAYSLGVVEEQNQNFEAALRLYQRSVKFDTTFENGYYNAAAMLANLKRFDEARATLRILLVLNPKADDAKQMMRQLQNPIAANRR